MTFRSAEFTSYPYARIAQRYGIPYGAVLGCVDRLEASSCRTVLSECDKLLHMISSPDDRTEALSTIASAVYREKTRRQSL